MDYIHNCVHNFFLIAPPPFLKCVHINIVLNLSWKWLKLGLNVEHTQDQLFFKSFSPPPLPTKVYVLLTHGNMDIYLNVYKLFNILIDTGKAKDQ